MASYSNSPPKHTGMHTHIQTYSTCCFSHHLCLQVCVHLSLLHESLFASHSFVSKCIFHLQGMYIKSTYDGLHVITGTTEGVRIFQLYIQLYKHVHFLLNKYHNVWSLMFFCSCMDILLDFFVFYNSSFISHPSLFCTFSPQLTAVRRFMRGMRSSRSTTKLWYASVINHTQCLGIWHLNSTLSPSEVSALYEMRCERCVIKFPYWTGVDNMQMYQSEYQHSLKVICHKMGQPKWNKIEES